MRIVIVDQIEITARQEHRLRSLGETVIHTDIPPAAELHRRLGTADIAILGWSTLDEAAFGAASRLKLVSLWSTGSDHVDLRAARQRGVVVTNVPGYGADTIAELTLAMAIALSRKLLAADRHVRSGGYDWRQFLGRDLMGQTLGVVGMGSIGAAVASRARALGLRVLATTARPSTERAKELGVDFVSLDELARRADILTIHCSLNDTTRGIIGRRELNSMKPGSFLINTSRAEIVDEAALSELLANGHLGGAALDVVASLPLDSKSPLATHPNVILTPHFAFHTAEALVRKTDICIANVESFLAGRPENVIT